MTAVVETIRPSTNVTESMPLDAVLGGLERAAARLPHAAAVPVIVAHAALSAVAYR